MKKLCLTALMGILLTLNAACNTAQGLGKDIRLGGEKLEREAKK